MVPCSTLRTIGRLGMLAPFLFASFAMGAQGEIPVPPLADAGGSGTVFAGEALCLDGSGSADQDGIAGGSAPQYRWDLDVTEDSDGNGIPDDDADAFGPKPCPTFDRAGTFRAKLLFIDDDGQPDESLVEIRVLSGPAALELCAARYRWAVDRPVPFLFAPPPFVFRGWMNVALINRGSADVFGVTATIACVPNGAKVLDGVAVLGDIPAGTTSWSQDSFSVETDSRIVRDPRKGICWRIDYDDAAGEHHVLEGVASFCDQPCDPFCPSPVNQSPAITSIPAMAAAEGESYAYDVDATDPDAGDTIAYSLDVAPAGMAIDPATGLIQWTPAAGQAGDQSVRIRAADPAGLFDTQTFTVAVAAADRAPSIVSAPVTEARERDPYAYDVDATDPDPADILSFSLPIAPAGMAIDPSTGLIAWTPTDAQLGPHDVTVRVEDLGGLSDTQAFVVTVAPVNDPPAITSAPVTSAAAGQPYAYDVEASDPDAGDVLTFSLPVAPAGMSIDPATGSIAWMPQAGDAGPNAVTVQVTDTGGLSDTQAFVVDVTVVVGNRPPEITSRIPTGATEAVPYVYDVEAMDPDAGDILTFSLPVAPQGMTIDPSTGLIAWTPTDAQIGPNDVTVRVEDQGGLADTQTFQVTVVSVNDPPEITSVPVTQATERQPYAYDVEATDPDAGDVLTFSLEFAPQGMTIDPSTGLIAWTPSDAQVGPNGVIVQVEDRGGLSDTQSFEVTVAGVNDPPEITSAAVTGATEGVPYVYDVQASDPDAGDVLTFSLAVAPEGMTIDPDSGLIGWTPAAAQVGPNDVTVRVEDRGGLSDTQSFQVTVVAVNDPPEIASSPVTSATEKQAYSYDVEASDPDAGDVLTFSLTSAPQGMTIDPTTGVIAWTPAESQVGQHPVTVRVEDRGGLFDTQSFQVVVQAVNDPPEITSPAKTAASEGEPYVYDVEAADPDAGDVLTFSLTAAPAGMAIDPATGLIQWTPTGAQVGGNHVTVRVEDRGGLFDTQSFQVIVQAVNDSPRITTPAVTAATEGEPYVYDVGAVDPDAGDVLTFSLPVAPAGMTIDPATGLIQWTPSAAQIGEHDVEVRVTDGHGGVAAQLFTIAVAPKMQDFTRPEVEVAVDPAVANVGSSVAIAVTARDDVGIVSRTLEVNGTPVDLDAGGRATYTSASPGIFSAVATARDAAGLEGNAAAEFRFLRPGDGTRPTVAIQTPQADASLSLPTNVVGTASDANLTGYRLEYSEAGRNEFVEFGRGTTSVTNGTLGTLDPTSMRNGIYEIRLTAEDASGNTASVSRNVRLEGEAKVGNFTIDFTDLTIPVAGMPISITRTYDSRRKTRGDFGIGWSLDVDSIQLSENGVMGEGWQQTRSGGFIPTYTVSPTRAHYVTVSYPDGRTDEFDMRIDPSSQQLIPVEFTTASFVARADTLSALVPLGETDLYVNGAQGPAELLYWSSFDLFDPPGYRLTSMDKTVFTFDGAGAIQTIQDPNANSITFGPGGIIHSAGKSVVFTRDAQGRITRVTDPRGNSILYAYDFYGDLISVTDQEGNTTRFTYNSEHGLLDIIDPLGRRPARSEYDDDGRLIAHIDAEGNRIEYGHDIGARQEIVKDRLGNITLYAYDANGNVIRETDPQGRVKEYSYDARGNRLSDTDALGHRTSFTYDARNNRTSVTDALGNRMEYSYDAAGNLLSTKDPEGHVTAWTFDARGNTQRTTDPLGNATSYTYDGRGNRTGRTDPRGATTRYEYDAAGNTIKEIDPLGGVKTYTYDANGNKLTETTERTTPAGKVAGTATYVYDAMNRLVETIDALGGTTRTEYDAVGKVSARIDALGRRTQYEYDARGNVAVQRFPDGTEERSTYDAESRRTALVDRAGRTTRNEYDAAGRIVRTTYPDGTATASEYDALGRMVKSIDGRGNATRYVYDAAGRQVEVTDALGNVVRYEYDRSGNKTKMTDANGHVTRYEYDAANQLTKTIHPDGTSTAIAYISLGLTRDTTEYKKASETDPAGRVTRFEYDALGRLVKVTDALGGATTYDYDEVGNLIEQTDANGRITRFEYDHLSRRTRRALPSGVDERWTYDAVGNRTSHTDLNGHTTTYGYDAADRLVEKVLPDGARVRTFYTAMGKREEVLDARGSTRYEYDARDRLTRTIDPDGRSISYTYDAAGNRTSIVTPAGTTQYAYDALNRLARVADPDGGVTTYAYDAVGNRASVAYPNGTAAEYTYDARDRLAQLTNKAGAAGLSSFAYTLGPAGNRTKVVEDSGRTVEYEYDALYRLTRERMTEAGGATRTIDYTYDAVGNRLTRTDGGVATAYAYDADDRMLSAAGATYTYDANGNLRSKTEGGTGVAYEYDFEDRMIQAQQISPTGTSTVVYTYDADGILVSEASGAEETHYLVDKNRRYAEVLLEADATGATIASYVFGDDLISQKRGAAASYFHYDGQMSTRQLTGAAGAVTDVYAYDAFGNLIARTGTTPNRHLYTGERLDPNIGFYYLRTRFYDPANGRFTRRDGWEGDIFDPESLHKYVYVENDPVDMIDPSGRFGVFSISISLSIHSILIGIYGGYLLGGTTAVLARVPDLAGKIATRYAILITAFAMGDVGGDRYPTWFGTPTAARLNHVSTGYSLIYDALHGPITFHYTSDDCYAYVYPGGPVEIWLGPLFFRAPLIGYDSRAGVIVHEVSHEVHGTDDYVYGQRNAKWLATNRPHLAIDNADNYEYFAEGSF